MRDQDGVTPSRGLNVGDPHRDAAEQGHLGQEAERFCWFKAKLDGKKLQTALRFERRPLPAPNPIWLG